MDDKLQAITVSRKTGAEQLRNGADSDHFSILDFWQWSASDILGNAMRGKFAEFVVACALGLEGGVRTEWDAYDLCTLECTPIEVKSSAYIQSWRQTKLTPATNRRVINMLVVPAQSGIRVTGSC